VWEVLLAILGRFSGCPGWWGCYWWQLVAVDGRKCGWKTLGNRPENRRSRGRELDFKVEIASFQLVQKLSNLEMF